MIITFYKVQQSTNQRYFNILKYQQYFNTYNHLTLIVNVIKNKLYEYLFII